MRLDFSISLDNPAQLGVKIHKLFQAVFVGTMRGGGRRSLDVYTCIIASATDAQHGLPRIDVFETVDDRVPTRVDDVSGIFFDKIEILRQWWGEESDRPESAVDLKSQISRRLGESQNIIDMTSKVWNESENRKVRPLLIDDQNDPPHYLVIPSAFEKNPSQDGPIASFTFPLEHTQTASMEVATGVWISTKYETIDPDSELIELQHRLTWHESLRINELRLYYCFPSQSVLSSFGGYVRPRGPAVSGGVDPRLEVYGIPAKRRYKYFQQWIDLGIYDSTLLRVRNSPDFARAVRDHVIDELNTELYVDDLRLRRRRTTHLLVVGIGLAAAVALGVDETRLSTTATMLPFKGATRELFWWLLMCLSVAPSLVRPTQIVYPFIANQLGNFALVGFTAWTAAAFFLAPTIQATIRTDTWGVYVASATYVCGALTFLAQRVEILIWLRRSIERIRRLKLGGRLHLP